MLLQKQIDSHVAQASAANGGVYPAGRLGLLQWMRQKGFRQKFETKPEKKVTYTNRDDGLWLTCECGWQMNLGYEPKFEQMFNAHVMHSCSDGA